MKTCYAFTTFFKFDETAPPNYMKNTKLIMKLLPTENKNF